MKNKPLLLSTVAVLAAVQASALVYDSNLWFGTIRPPLAPPTGQVIYRIIVGDNFKGLTYADQNLIGSPTTPTLFYSIRHDAVSGVSHLDTIATPVAPHTAPPPVVDRFSVGSLNYNALTFASPDLGYGSTLLYYLREDVTASKFGTITGAGAFQDRFGTGNKLDSLTFTATDVSFGANLFYYLRRDLGGTHFGTINPALPGTMMDRWLLTSDNFDAFVATSTDVGYGANLFYFIRHDVVTGQHQFGTINPLTGVALDRFPIGTVTDKFTELTFTTTDMGYGPNLFYYLRGTQATAVPETGGGWPLVSFASIFGAWQGWVVWRRKAGRS